MARSIWKGAVSFGLVTIPVKLYGATEAKDVSFFQVHPADGGRIRYKRVCEVCGNEVPFAEIGKGFDAGDGRVAVLEASDFADLPLPTAKQVEIVQFTDLAQIDPTLLDRAYFLEADGPGAKPYVLLREALAGTGKVAIVKVALRSRESLALVRAHGEVLMLHTMLWPDELRDGSFAVPTADVKASEAEVAMAQMFIDQLSGDFDPTQFTDSYREALEQVVAAKLEGIAPPTAAESPPQAEVVDLVAALKASVEAAKARRDAAHQATDTGPGKLGSKAG